MGVLRLPRSEFRKMTPEEFHAVCEAHVEAEERRERQKWERMRLLATITIQPHVKDRVTPQQLLPLPWDESAPVERMTKEERMARAQEALKRFG